MTPRLLAGLSRLRIAAGWLLTLGCASAQHFTTYDLVVPVTATSTLTTVDGAGRTLPPDRSFVIGLQGGLRGPLVIQNFTGSPDFPIVIVNQHGTGRVVVTDVAPEPYTRRDGIVIRNCRYFQLRGDNDPSLRYGIEVAQVGNKAGHSRVGINLTGTSSDGEVRFVEVHDSGFAGIMAKSDPSCSAPAIWAANYVMRNIHIHHTYIHDVGGEGMYLGYTKWHDQLTCDPAVNPPPQGHEIHGLRVNHNLIERSGWDGAQVASNPVDTKVHDNVILDSGMAPSPGQGNGFQIGGGGTGEYFNNTIINSAYNSFVIIGQIGNVSVYNNLFVNAGDYGIFAKNLPDVVPSDPDARQTIPGTFVNIFNNTIINPANGAYLTLDEVSVNNFQNNVLVVPNTAFGEVNADGGATVNTAGNVLRRSVADLSFVNPAQDDYRLLGASPAVNAGVPLGSLSSPAVPVTTDFFGSARPQGTAFDAGYHEAGGLALFLHAVPPAGGQPGSIQASVQGGTAPYTYAWSTGATSASISSLPVGRYEVSVTDAVGAKVNKGVYLFEGAEAGAPVQVTPPNQVIAPIFDVAPGTYATPPTVSIITPTPGDVLRYTTDGSTPTTSRGATYSGPIVIGHTSTLKAVAYKSGMITSDVTVGTYVVQNGPVDTKFTLTDAQLTASGHVSTHVKGRSVDGSLSTYWRGDGDGSWLQADLGSPQRVALVRLTFLNSHQQNNDFDLQVSADGLAWTNVLTNWSSSRDLQLQTFDFPDVDGVRYVRFVGHGNNNPNVNHHPWNAVTEWEVWGGAAGSAGARGTYQAENAVRNGATVKTNQTGYTGTGFTDFGTTAGEYVEWTVVNPIAGSRALTFRYQMGGSPRALDIAVNGVVVVPGLSFNGTGGPGIWVNRSAVVNLPAGAVTIRATVTGTDGPNLDYLRID